MIPIDFTVLIQAIAGIVNPTAMLRNKLERNETVIRLLRQFNLSPDSPPADFSGVYAYTLVEYGVGKSQVVLELFRQTEIRQAFQDAWGQDNFSVLLKAGEEFLESAGLGDELRAVGIDARQEFYQFAAVFIAIAKRTRTPGDILTAHQLNSLHRQIAQVQDRLERLPSIEGIRTEMARLTAQPVLALPGASGAEQCSAFALAQQMRGWFETLGYRFEAYELWQATAFEWIINIPVRRGRYDRILVRGIEGEAELRDVMALRQSVEAQQADEGWLVTSRRISRAARDEVEKPENRHLDCYAFDELVDLDADFTGYIEWLDAEIKRRKIDTRYVPLGCTKEEIDPDTQQRLGVSRYDERDGWIDGYLDRWLDDPAKEHISVLGEFGTGKTWVAFHYAWTALQRYQEAKERGVQRPRLPLIITLRDYAKALNVENVLAGFFFTQHNIRLNSEVFDQLNRMGKLLLIFDGFDEMAAKVDKQQMINNFWELAKVVLPGAKVILTCRTEHFPDAREGRALLNAQLQASTSNLTGETPQFEVLELEKFNDEQIRQVMSFQASMPTVEQVISNPQLLDLARRPVMTELILEALPEIEAGKPVDMSRVYLYAVRRKMERDIKAERTFTSLADKLYFLCELSWEMLSSDRMSLNYREFPDRIRRLFGSAVQEEKDLDHWHYDMMGQTMLIRNADGDYSPAHRSLLEFFVAYKFAAELGALSADFLDLAQKQVGVNVNVNPQRYTWSAYFQGGNEQLEPLQGFISESLEILQSGFGRTPLTKAVMDLLAPIVEAATSTTLHSSADENHPLLKVVEATRGQPESEVNYVGGNAVSILLHINKMALSGKDLRETVVKGANFAGARLQNANFANAHLSESIFTQTFNQIFSVIFSHDGASVITGGGKNGSGELHRWSLANGQCAQSFMGHTDVVRSIILSSDSQLLVSGSADCTIKIWDFRTSQCLKTLRKHTAPVRAVALSPDGQTLVSGAEDQTLCFWNMASGDCISRFSEEACHIRALTFSPDGQTLASSSEEYTVKLWQLRTGQSFKLFGHTNWVKTVAFSPDGQTLASGSQDYTIKLWNVQTGECLQTLQGHTHQINAVAFSPDGKWLTSSSIDMAIKLWDTSTGLCCQTLRGHDNSVQAIAFSPDSRNLVSGSQDHSIKLWDLRTGQFSQTLQGYANWIKSISFSPDDRSIASGGQDRALSVWDIDSGKCTFSLDAHSDWIMDVAYSPDGKILASASLDCTIKLWSIPSTDKCLVLRSHTMPVRSISFSPDGQLLASGGQDSMLRIWDACTGECTKVLSGHSDFIDSVIFDPNGQTLISSSADHSVKFWDLKSGECFRTLTHAPDWAKAIAFCAKNQIFATGSDDYVVRIWDITTGQCVRELKAHTGQIKALAFSPDGEILASAGDDFTIKFWNVQRETSISTPQEHLRTIGSLIFNSTGERLASCSEDGTIKLWNSKTAICLGTFEHTKPYEGMNIAGVVGLTEVEKTTLGVLGAINNQP